MKPKRRSEMREKSNVRKERSEHRDKERSNRDRERREKRSDRDRSQKDRDKEYSGRDRSGDDEKRRTRSKSKDRRDKDRERNHDRQRSKSEKSQDAYVKEPLTPKVPPQPIPSSSIDDKFDAMTVDPPEMDFSRNTQFPGILDQKSQIRSEYGFPEFPNDPKLQTQNFANLPPDPRIFQQPPQDYSQDTRSSQKYSQDTRAVQPYSQDIRSPHQFAQDIRAQQPYLPDVRSPQQFSQDSRAPQQYSPVLKSPQQLSQDSRAAPFSDLRLFPQQFPQDPRFLQQNIQDPKASQQYPQDWAPNFPDLKSPQINPQELKIAQPVSVDPSASHLYSQDSRTHLQHTHDPKSPQKYPKDPRTHQYQHDPRHAQSHSQEYPEQQYPHDARLPLNNGPISSPMLNSQDLKQSQNSPYLASDQSGKNRNSTTSKSAENPQKRTEIGTPHQPLFPERQNSRNPNATEPPFPIEKLNLRNERNNFGSVEPFLNDPAIEHQNFRNNIYSSKDSPIEGQNSGNNPNVNELPIERQNSRNNTQQQPRTQDIHFGLVDNKIIQNVPMQNDPLPFNEICGGCGREITEEEEEDCFEIDALNKLYHVDCFRCCVCQTAFSDENPYIPHSGKAYCETHYEEFVYQPVCAGCKAPIFGQPISALGKPWHPEHLVCSLCSKPIQGNVFEHKGVVYCASDFTNLVAPTCRACHNPVQGETICAMGNTYHRACFVCTKCHKNFENKSFYVFNGEPYCKIDYHDCNNSLCGECQLPIEGDN
ncbi:hypothetical protein HK096_006158 [Nowakowskiella sp. JEL0078]|nr:hypothetical protein HK096_006158 [Nowakowskiella sp. JEL0078]